MKKILFALTLCFCLSSFHGTACAWEGRMAGMGNPSGLTEDSSDVLVHPSKLKSGEAGQYYGHFQYTYRDVKDWDYRLDRSQPNGAFLSFRDFDASGTEHVYNAGFGSTLALGAGTLGIFLSYDGAQTNHDGNEAYRTATTAENFVYNLDNDVGDIAIRSIYGFQVGGKNIGLELGFAYRDRENRSWINDTLLNRGTQNYPWSWAFPHLSTFPHMIPYASEYYELQGKAGIEGKIKSADIFMTVRGSHIISGDNSYIYIWQRPVNTTTTHVDMDGDADGYGIGSDIWCRHFLRQGLSLPFLLSLDYIQVERDGRGANAANGDQYTYWHDHKAFQLTLGGGVEIAYAKGDILGLGLYYRYSDAEDAVWFRRLRLNGTWRIGDNSESPQQKAHRLTLRLSREKEISTTTVLRGGFEAYYGLVDEDYTHLAPLTNTLDSFSIDGAQWGIQGSFGCTYNAGGVSFEPHLNAGFSSLDLEGPGSRNTETWVNNLDKVRREWFIGVGITVLFGHKK